jgi:hypothetical protein
LNEVARLGDPLGVGDWNSRHQEWIKSDGDPITERADKGRLELAMEQVADQALIPVDVLIPSILGCLGITLTICISLLNIWLFILLVEIFSHKVQNSIDALLGVMLTISFESDVVLAKDPLEEIRSHNLVAVLPHLSD